MPKGADVNRRSFLALAPVAIVVASEMPTRAYSFLWSNPLSLEELVAAELAELRAEAQRIGFAGSGGLHYYVASRRVPAMINVVTGHVMRLQNPTPMGYVVGRLPERRA